MLMRTCPHCGADNSIRRTTCFQCQQAFPAAGAQQPEQTAPTAASSRWDAIDLGKAKSRQLRPAAEQFPQSQAPAAPAAKAPAHSYMPTFRRPLRHIRNMGVFFRELHTLTRAGITVAHACREVSRHSPGKLSGLAAEMERAADQGEPIHTVMEQHRDLFYPWHIGLVGAAQAGGNLPEAFDQIARAYETEWNTRATLMSRLVFYLIAGLPPILITIPLLLMLNQPIPKEGWTPQVVIQTALHFFRTVSLSILAALVALYLIWTAISGTAFFQGVQQRVIIHLPMVGGVARTAALDRYLGTLGLLLRGGIPVAAAAEQAASAAGNVAITPKLYQVAEEVRAGTPLAAALENTRTFDRDTLSMASTGEVSGSLPDMLARAAGYYRESHEAKRRMLLRLATVSFSVLWLILVGAIFLIGLQIYFNYAFRVFDWMLE